MPALAQSDLQAALDVLCEAEGVDGVTPFPSQLLDRLRELVPSDWVAYNELDRPGGRILHYEACARGREVDEAAPPEVRKAFWPLRDQHPICAYQDRSGDFAAQKLSDFVQRREWHRLEIYRDYFRHFNTECLLTVGLPAPPWHTKLFMFGSAKRDYSERDRLLLNLLRPHLVHLYESAKTRRLAAALAAGAEAEGELLVLDSTDAIEFATANARRLLRHYIGPARGSRLPASVKEWLRHEGRLLNDGFRASGSALSFERGNRRLVILSPENGVLLLREESAPIAARDLLSWREWQVLALVEKGKSNAEIAAVLWIAAGTVRKHLENIYAKLGAHSRTAAVARAREIRRTLTLSEESGHRPARRGEPVRPT